MRSRHVALLAVLVALVLAGAVALTGQIKGTITSGEKPTIAVPDFRGTGAAEPLMGTFNDTLWKELSGSGVLNMAPKTTYPLEIPQQPADFRAPAMFSGWTQPPVKANYLAFGYTAVVGGRLMLYGYLFNVGQPDIASAQVFGKVYPGSLDQAGSRLVAKQFAADILKQLGGTSLLGTKIYFVSDRTGSKEIWSMDYDGSGQRRLTNYNSVTMTPTVSADGTLFAATTFAAGLPQIQVFSTDSGRRRSFANLKSSLVTTPEFTPDGKKLLFAASIDGWTQLWIANVDGSDMTRLSNVKAVEVEPRVNPKTSGEVLFTSARATEGRLKQYAQVWRMNLDGSDKEMLTSGEGEATNASWSPDGHHIAFAWTRGYDPGNYNIFIMDIADRKPVQLTHGNGKNENPWWAPDGVHLVFASTRGRVSQIYTMLADGTNVQQLTTQGNNYQPVWAKGTE